jgi:hypothetical protein
MECGIPGRYTCFWDMRGRLGMLIREEGLETYRYNTNHDTTRNERYSNITLSFLTTEQDRSDITPQS